MFKFEITATTAKELKSSIAEFNTVFFPEEDSQLTLNLIEEENIKASQSVPTAIVEEAEVLSSVSIIEETPIQEPVQEPIAPQAPADEEDDEEIEPVTSGDRDSRGIIWDARVHSAHKSYNKDGSWRTRRNLAIGLVEKVEAEQMCRTLPPPVAPYNPPPMEPQVKYPIHHTPVAVPPAPVVVAPVAPPPPIEPVTRSKPMHSYVSFKQNFMGTLSILQSTGKIDKAYIQSLCEYFKVDGIWNVLYNEQHCTELYDCLVANDLITKVG